jgi:hypothetical protein
MLNAFKRKDWPICRHVNERLLPQHSFFEVNAVMQWISLKRNLI